MTACAQSLYSNSQEAGEEAVEAGWVESGEEAEEEAWMELGQEAEEERNQRRRGSNGGGRGRGLSEVKRLGGGKT